MKNTILNLLKACSRLKEVESIYASMIKIGTNQDCFLMNQFISLCFTFSQINYATSAFVQMENPNVFVYNSMMRGFVRCFHPKQALQYYVFMLREEVTPTSYTFSSLLKACTSLMVLWFGKAVHGQIWKHGFESHVFVQTALIDLYSKLGDIGDSGIVFDDMPERDVFAWTIMISALVRIGDMISARRLFDQMSEKNTATWNTMIDGYARSGSLQSAELLFHEMPARDVISWTIMISCYSQNKKFREALAIFNDMTINGISPDPVTLSTVISACAHLGALDLGKELHLYVMLNGFDLDVYIGSALIDMYAKCGNLERSLVVFFKMQNKNLFCWNSVIEGLAAHGFAAEALRMFNRMEKHKIKPNAITFISILGACTHVGFVEEGRRTFQSMIDDYSIPPQVEHYGCMVDLLSKAGLLEDALEIIRSMECEPNSVIWGALLGGCKLHRNLDIADVAVSNLMVLEPNNSGYYNLLLNMYAEVNLWGEVAKIRTIMKDLGLEKICPGSSSIEMERKIHRFAATDKSHLSSSEIYLLLSKLDGQLKLAGYAHELETIL
ncbi:Pentatricopeptide repeat-containing protein [Quillaja saponaria]|uniref:Pentatricopeptide repeat-containing protein n=1 Tax=Quillaja saponaria TaxID=32244 RepID=A0AAD7LQ21_QUISA|nr:Pentatricopeptide repeat-containing protein [Quillaja saponaria]